MKVLRAWLLSFLSLGLFSVSSAHAVVIPGQVHPVNGAQLTPSLNVPTGFPVPTCFVCNPASPNPVENTPFTSATRNAVDAMGNVLLDANNQPVVLQVQPTIDGNRMTVVQDLDRQVFNWRSFDINAGNTVEFQQPRNTSIALNRVVDPAASASQIAGQLLANGQVYIINRNGVVFKQGASVNVQTLLASTLDLNQLLIDNDFERFRNTGLGDLSRQEVETTASPANVDGNLQPDLVDANLALFDPTNATPEEVQRLGLPANVTVEAGAVIEAGDNGRVILVGSNVVNNGVIRVSGPHGQALLVAGSDAVYFFDNRDISRGLAVELDTLGGAGDCLVRNVGEIVAGNGNITLAGMVVNQAGLLRATNAVNANGSIRLQARSKVSLPQLSPSEIDLRNAVTQESLAEDAGEVVFSSGSVTEILVDDGDGEAVDGQTFNRARVEVRGENITMQSGARITAKAGAVQMIATDTPEIGNTPLPANSGVLGGTQGSITLESGAIIDVSGLEDVVVDGNRNIQSVQLRGNELAGSPINRDGPLFGSTITVDIRQTLSVANISGAIAALGRTIEERSTLGGTVDLLVGDLFNFAPGAIIDVSGGSVFYTEAQGATTKVLVGGVIRDLSDIGPNTRVDAVLNGFEVTDPKWGFVQSFASPVFANSSIPAYTEGRDAGSVTIQSVNRFLNTANAGNLPVRGELAGSVFGRQTRGIYQRELASTLGTRVSESGEFPGRAFDEVPLAGSLRLLLGRGNIELRNDEIGDAGGPNSLQIDGVNRIDIIADSFLVSDDIDLGYQAALDVETLGAGGINIAGQLRARGAEIVLKSTIGGDLTIEDGASIEVQGGFVSEISEIAIDGPRSVKAINGGAITLAVSKDNALVLQSGSLLDVSGGIQILTDGSFVPGDGGDLALNRREGGDTPATKDDPVRLTLAGSIRGFVFPGDVENFAERPSSSLSISTNAIELAPIVGLEVVDTGPVADQRLVLGADYLNSMGFTDISLTSEARPLVIKNGFDFELQPEYFGFDAAAIASGGGAAFGGAAALETGVELSAVTATSFVSDPLMRRPTSITLTGRLNPSADLAAVNTPPAVLVMEEGSRLATDIGGAITLSSNGSIVIDGELETPGGAIAIELARGPRGQNLGDTVAYESSRGIWVLPNARLDASAEVVRGPVDELGRETAYVFNAGAITLDTGNDSGSSGGYVFVFPGSEFDVSGREGLVELAVADSLAPRFEEVEVAADAGTIEITAGFGFQFFADLDGSANAGLGAAGGALKLTLEVDDRSVPTDSAANFPASPNSRIEIDPNAIFPGALGSFGPVLNDALFQVGNFSTAEYLAGGFESLSLNVPRASEITADPATMVQLVGDFSFNAGRVLEINAPIISSTGGSVLLQADYLRLGQSFRTSGERGSFASTPGNGVVAFDGGYLDFVGHLATDNIGAVLFNSASDIRLGGYLPAQDNNDIRLPLAELNVDGDILFRAQRIFVPTLTNFKVANAAVDGTVSFLGPTSANVLVAGGLPGVALNAQASQRFAPVLQRNLGDNQNIPLAAAGRLDVDAEYINQFGNVFVPLGSIDFDADKSLTLGAGSLTSVSAVGNEIVFGETLLGEWSLNFQTDPVLGFFPDLTNGFTLVLSSDEQAFAIDDARDDPTEQFLLLPPEKRIRLVADGVDGMGQAEGLVDLRAGARIDLRGGGDLLATEFVPGPGGRTDLLSPFNEAGAFALLPTETGVIAPFDATDTERFNSVFGDRLTPANQQITILDGGTSGLASGTYAVAPARMAVLPGAYLLTPDNDSTVIFGGTSLGSTADGAAQVRGQLTQLGQGVGPGTVGQVFRAETLAEFSQRAEYRITRASSFFTAQASEQDLVPPLLPADAGLLQLLPNAGLNLGAQVVAGNSAAGLRSRVDISADNIELVDVAAPVSSAVQLATSGLEQLGAASYLIGGQRTQRGNKIVVQTTADNVTLLSGASLTAPELLLTARTLVDVESGGAVNSSGIGSEDRAVIELASNAGLLAIGAGPLASFSRTDQAAGSTVQIRAGANIAARSVLADGTSDVQLAGNLNFLTPGELGIGAPKINIGGGGSTEIDPVALGTLARVELRSSGAVSFFGDTALIADEILIDAAGLRGEGVAGNIARLAANQISLGNRSGNQLAPGDFVGAGSGDLLIEGLGGGQAATALVFLQTLGLGDERLNPAITDDGDFDVLGFSATTLNSPSVFGNADYQLEAQGDLVVNTGQISAAPGTFLGISATGTFKSNALVVDPLLLPNKLDVLGSTVAISARSIESAAPIKANSGLVRFSSSSDGTNPADKFEISGLVDVSGLDNETFGLTTVSSDAGWIQLVSEMGSANVTLGGAGGAGTLNLAGENGALTIRVPNAGFDLAAGSIVNAGAGAELEIDLGSIPDIVGLEAALDGFTGSKAFRVRAGDLTVSNATFATERIKLVADSGDINIVNALLDASGPWGGTIELHAGNESNPGKIITLGAGAKLNAFSTGLFNDGSLRSGGQVVLSSPDGWVDLSNATAEIDVGSYGSGVPGVNAPLDTGSVRIIAKRTAGNNGLQVGDGANLRTIETQIAGAESDGGIALIGHRRYEASIANVGDTVQTEAVAFSDATVVANLLAALNVTSADGFRVGPGVELVFSNGLAKLSDVFANQGDIDALLAEVSEIPGPDVLTCVGGPFCAFFPNPTGPIPGVWELQPGPGVIGPAAAPGVLTIRAAADLEIDHNLMDGFLVSAVDGLGDFLIADDRHSWTLQIIGGADTASADLTATKQGGGSLVVNNDIQITTGSGDLVLAAADDITLRDGANVFVAGKHTAGTVGVDDVTKQTTGSTYAGTISDAASELFQTGVSGVTSPQVTPADLALPGTSFPTTGGDLLVHAGGSITRENPSNQEPTAWQTRIGNPNGIGSVGQTFLSQGVLEVIPSAYGLVYGFADPAVVGRETRGFNQGFAAFGGGNLRIRSGGDITGASFSIATTGRQDGINDFDARAISPGAFLPDVDNVWRDDLSLDGLNEDFFDQVTVLGGGRIDVRTEGSIEKSTGGGPTGVYLNRGDAKIRAIGDIDVDYVAQGDAAIELVSSAGDVVVGQLMDPQLIVPSTDNPVPVPVGGQSLLFNEGLNANRTAYFSYGADSLLEVRSFGGNVKTVTSATNIAFEKVDPDLAVLSIAPPSLTLSAFTGSVEQDGLLNQFSSTTGGVDIAAGRDIFGSSVDEDILLQWDIQRGELPSAADPALRFDIGAVEIENTVGSFSRLFHSSVPAHSDDATPSTLTALGNIRNLRLEFAEQSRLFAGNDVTNIHFVGQNVNPTDLTLVASGRDVRFDTQRTTRGLFQLRSTQPLTDASGIFTQDEQIALGGPGELQVVAGRHVNLGASDGIRTFGDEDNAFLADEGADLLVIAGADPRATYESFIKRYLDGGEGYLPDLGTLIFALNNLDSENLTAALTQLAGLSGGVIPTIEAASAPTASQRAQLANEIRSALASVAEETGESGNIAPLDLAFLLELRDNGAALAEIRSALDGYLATLESAGVIGPANGLSAADRFRDLGAERQRSFVFDVLGDELKASAFEAANSESGFVNDFSRGRVAIATVFEPLDAQGGIIRYEGNISSPLSAVSTFDGGSINVFAPGGFVDAGATAEGPQFQTAGGDPIKSDINLGYVAFRSGAVNMFTERSINVNSTRIFAQRDGDIVLWSNRANIDAGRGRRDAQTVADSVAVFDEFLNAVDEPPLTVSGSGVSTKAPVGFTAGSIFVSAPEGIVDAGDAGFNSESGLVVAAREVANREFFTSSGPTIGVPQAAGAVGASLGNLGDVSAAATQSVTEAAQSVAAAAAADSAGSGAGAGVSTRLNVKVISFGN
ncbi:MAG: filamentous hemagglutinin N-terminal domain-containing protein [Pseudomonadota bacterium]